MYNFYNAVGWQAVFFYAVVAFIIHLMLARLFIAIFLCYFRRNLEKNDENEKDENKSQSSKMGSEKKEGINEFLQSKEEDVNDNRSLGNNKENSKLFWVFGRNSCIFQMLRAFYNS